MKKVAIIILVLLSTAVFSQKKQTVTITGGELIIGNTANAMKNTYKGNQIVNYNLNTDGKVNIYFVGTSNVITLDTAKMYSYNGSTTMPSAATLTLALKTITVPTLGYLITGTAKITTTGGTWFNAIGTTVIDSIYVNGAWVEDVTLATDASIYGAISYIRLTSGSGIVYK